MSQLILDAFWPTVLFAGLLTSLAILEKAEWSASLLKDHLIRKFHNKRLALGALKALLSPMGFVTFNFFLRKLGFRGRSHVSWTVANQQKTLDLNTGLWILRFLPISLPKW